MQRWIERWREDARTAPDIHHVDTCDGIRAVAIMIVGWFHVWQLSWLAPRFTVNGYTVRTFDNLVRTGYIWVDVVLLISGFCLYLPWARMRHGERRLPHPLDFYAKRLIRIHPSNMLIVFVLLAVAIAERSYATLGEQMGDLIAHLTYTQLFFYDTYYNTRLGTALWTLAVEMQFYLVFPLLARAFLKKPVHTFGVMIALAFAYRGIVGASMFDVSMYFNQFPALLDIFALGMAAAELHVMLSARGHNALTRIAASCGTVLSAVKVMDVIHKHVLVGGTIMIRRAQMDYRFELGVWAALLLLFSAQAGLGVRRLLSNRVTRFISSVSMQFYIWHQTLAVWLLLGGFPPSRTAEPHDDVLWQHAYTIVCLAGALALAALLTYSFERPIARRLGAAWQRMRQKRRNAA